MTSFSVVGRRVARVDGVELTTGEAIYASDVKLPHMLYGKVLRANLPHARIVNIDTVKAERLAGVKAVVTAADTPKITWSLMQGEMATDKLLLADKKVRYIGDEVAALAAIDEEIAEEALRLIEVEYQELPAYFDPMEAIKPDSLLIHDHKPDNIAARLDYAQGDIDKGFAEADLIYEDEYLTGAVYHSCMETHCCLAKFDFRGNLSLWTSIQSPHFLRHDLARVLDMPWGKIRVMKTQVGGGFGSKSRMKEVDAICSFLAKKSGQPVKIVYTREEDFAATRARHPTRHWVKMGIKRDGTITAVKNRVIVDAGAYNDVGQEVANPRNILGVFRVANFQGEGLAVYTNNPFGGRFRAFNTVPQRFGFEAHIDQMATMIGLDPLQVRLKNAHKTGDTIFGLKLGSCGLTDCINQAAGLLNWKEKKRAKTAHRGLGMACMTHPGSGAPGEFSGALVKLEDEGMVTVLTGATEIGGGQDTLVAQITAEVLGVSLEKIKVVGMDTEVTPIDFGSRASRSTFMVGNAVKAAAADARHQLLQRAAERLEASLDDLEIKDGMIYVRGTSAKGKSIGDILLASTSPKSAGKGGPYLSHPIYGRGTFIRGKMGTRVAAFAAQAVELEVDPLTGAVRILQFIAAHDAGRAINLLGAEGQIEGGVSQGIGYGLTEGLERERGKNINGNLMDYKLPCAADMPPLKSCIIEPDEPEGPFGAKGIGEPPSVPTAPAIANAVYDAIGVMIKELPITPEKVLNALREKERRKTLPPPVTP